MICNCRKKSFFVSEMKNSKRKDFQVACRVSYVLWYSMCLRDKSPAE